MPALDRLAASLRGAPVEVLPITMDASGKADVAAFYAKYDLTHLPVYVDSDQQVGHLGHGCKNPDVAADFLKFMVDEENVLDFVTTAQFLPVRRSLAAKELPYKLRPEAMGVFVRQASTIPSHMVATETLPNFSRINARLADELDLAFTSGQDAAATARNIDSQVQAILAA
jgi:multiple sugar transport system substrate-binding protein